MLQVIHSHSRRKHYTVGAGRPTPSGYLYPALCNEFTWGMEPEEFVRRYAPYGGKPQDHPMCKHCIRIVHSA